MVVAGSQEDAETYCLPLKPMFDTMTTHPDLPYGAPRLYSDAATNQYWDNSNATGEDRASASLPLSNGDHEDHNEVKTTSPRDPHQTTVEDISDSSSEQQGPGQAAQSEGSQPELIPNLVSGVKISNDHEEESLITRVSKHFVSEQALLELGHLFYEETSTEVSAASVIYNL